MAVHGPIYDWWNRVKILPGLRLAVSVVCVLTMGGCESATAPTAAAARPFVFPTGLGSYWHYEITLEATLDTLSAHPLCEFDSLELTYTRRDTVTVMITGVDTIASGEVASRLQYSKSLNAVDWYLERLWVTGGTGSGVEPLRFWATPRDSGPALVFRRPLEGGSSWECFDCSFLSRPDYQRYTVEYVPMLKTKGGNFTGLYKVTNTFGCGDECGGLMSWWLKSGVGVVRFTQSVSSGGSPCLTYYSNATWELTEYEISR